MSSLLFRLEPICDESLLSLVARTAHENELRPGDIAHLVGVGGGAVLPLLFGKCDLPHLARRLGCDLEDVERRKYAKTKDGRHAFFNTTVDREHLCFSTRRFAPRALAKSAYHRAKWDISFIFSDAETGEMLQSKCPECEAEQTWQCDSLVKCRKCGFDLRKAPERMVDPALKEVAGFVHGIVDPSIKIQARSRIHLVPDLIPMPVSDLIELMTMMGSLAIKHSLERAFCIPDLPPGHQIEAMMRGYSLFPDWPSSAIQLVERELNPVSEGRHREALTYARAFPFIGPNPSKAAQSFFAQLVLRVMTEPPSPVDLAKCARIAKRYSLEEYLD